MELGDPSATVHGEAIPPVLAGRPDLVAPRLELPTFARAELRAQVFRGENDSDACERVLAQAARVAGALELALGDGLAELQKGDRLMQLGFSRLKDYAGNVLEMSDRKAQAAAQLSRGLSSRPVLAAATRAGVITPRKALTVLRVARGEAQARWVERAKALTVRGLEAAVRAELKEAGLPGGDAAEVMTRELEEPGVPLRMWLRRREDRASFAEALQVAATLLPGSKRWEQLEAMAQEYNGGHPLDEADLERAERESATYAARRGLRGPPEPREVIRARLEAETERWAFLDPVAAVEAPDVAWAATAEELDAQLCGLKQEGHAWDEVVGYCARVVKESGLPREAGFESFDHYSKERLGLSPRTVEQRASLEGRIARVPALRAARAAGLPYSKLLVISRLPDREIAAMAARAPKLTVVELQEAVDERTVVAPLAPASAVPQPQMCAARVVSVWVPARVDLELRTALLASQRYEGETWDYGECLGRVSRHFLSVWKDAVPRPKTLSQKVRARDARCFVPGCSLPSDHAHHVDPRAQGGEDSMENEGGGCIPHHVGIHKGYLTVTGKAPDQLTWTVGGKVWKDAEFGRGPKGAAVLEDPDDDA